MKNGAYKKILSIALALVMALGLLPTMPVTVKAAGATGSTGTADYDWYNNAGGASGSAYSIGTADELAGLANIVNGTAAGIPQDDFSGKTITMTADIDLSAYGTAAGYDGGKGWKPIGESYSNQFTGTFDGNNKVITNLTINRPSEDYVGLFGVIDYGGTVKNLGISGGSVTGHSYVGGLAGANSGTISNSYNNSAVTGYSGVGGLVGNNGSGTISNSYNSGAVSGTGSNSRVGGLAGFNGGAISNSYNSGAVSSTGYASRVGGLAGVNTGTISNSYNSGAVSATGDYGSAGGLAGLNDNTITNCYYDLDKYTGDAVGYGSGGSVTNCNGLTTAAMTDANVLGGDMSAMNTDSAFVKPNYSLVTNGCATSFYPELAVFAGSTSDFTKDMSKISVMAGSSCGVLDADEQCFAHGGGVNGNPFLIYTAAQLNHARRHLDAHFIMMNDIDLSAYGIGANYDNGAGWKPIGENTAQFAGTFNGNGCVITNLTINRPGDYYIGLFGYIGTGGTVKNLGISGGSVTGNYYVGGLAGYNDGTISNSYNSGAVSGTGNNSYVGGLAGYNDGSISSCYNSGAVSGTGSNSLVGGLAGVNWSQISNSYNSGAVSGTGDNSNVGGLAGYNVGTISNSFNSGAVSGTGSGSFVGGLAGFNGTGASITNCYYDITKYTGNAVGDGIGSGNQNGGLTTAVMTAADVLSGAMSGLNTDSAFVKPTHASAQPGCPEGFYPELAVFANSADSTVREMSKASVTTQYACGSVGADEDHFTAGDGTSTSPYQITTAAQLNHVRKHLTAHFIMMNDIDLSAYGIGANYDNGAGWKPIGENTAQFAGTFNGNGCVITNLTINRPGDYYIGLFGYIGTGGTVKNLGISGGSVTGISSIGGLAGRNYGTISNCYNSGVVTGSGDNDAVGGLVGQNHGSISNSYNSGTVIVPSTGINSIGGLVGYNIGTISNCYNSGVVTGTGTSSSVGGLAGSNSSSGQISNCYYDKEKYTGNAVGGGTGSVTGCNGLTTAVMTAANALQSGGAMSAMNVGSAFIKPNHTSTQLGCPEGFYPELAVFANSADSTVQAMSKASVTTQYACGVDTDEDHFTVGDGTSTSPYQITTAGQLNHARKHLSAHFIMMNDIDLTAYGTTAGYDGGKGWKPIGDSSITFTGNFDGGGYVITNLTINRSTEDYIGLFGVIGGGGEVKNLGISGGSVTGKDYVGGLAGKNMNQISNSYNSGAVEGNSYVGGLAGENSWTITNSYNSGAVSATGSGSRVGGLAGVNSAYGTIENCYNSGAVSGTGYGSYVGGLAGLHNREGTITNCYYDITKYTGGAVGGGTGSVNSDAGLTTAEMIKSDVLETGGDMSALGTTDWSKRLVAADYCYYPELAVFYTGTAAQQAASELSARVNRLPVPGVSATATGIAQGQPLSASTLTGSAPITGSFAWENANFKPGAGVQTCNAVFTPSGEFELYKPTVVAVQVTVTGTPGGEPSPSPSPNPKPEEPFFGPELPQTPAPQTPAYKFVTLHNTKGGLIGSYDTTGKLKNGVMTINPSVQKDGYVFGFNLLRLKELENANKGGKFVLTLPGIEYELPFDMINVITGLAELLGNADLKDYTLELTITKLTGDDLAKAQANFKKAYPNGELPQDFYDISFTLYKNGVRVEFDANKFNSAAAFSLSTSKKCNAVFKYDPAAGRFSFVPATFGDTSASVKTMTHSIYTAAKNSVAFPDVNPGAWYEPFVARAANKGLAEGYQGLFRPENAVTRAEFVQMIVNAVQLPAAKADTKKYGDVTDKNEWYYNAVMTAKSAGMLDGFTGDDFKPNKAITREEMASVLAAALRRSGTQAATQMINLEQAYSDYADMDKKYLVDIELVCNVKLMQGVGGGMFDPKGVTTRAQAATAQIRLLEILGMIDIVAK